MTPYIYKCSTCSSLFRNANDLIDHVERQHNMQLCKKFTKSNQIIPSASATAGSGAATAAVSSPLSEKAEDKSQSPALQRKPAAQQNQHLKLTISQFAAQQRPQPFSPRTVNAASIINSINTNNNNNANTNNQKPFVLQPQLIMGLTSPNTTNGTNNSNNNNNANKKIKIKHENINNNGNQFSSTTALPLHFLQQQQLASLTQKINFNNLNLNNNHNNNKTIKTIKTTNSNGITTIISKNGHNANNNGNKIGLIKLPNASGSLVMSGRARSIDDLQHSAENVKVESQDESDPLNKSSDDVSIKNASSTPNASVPTTPATAGVKFSHLLAQQSSTGNSSASSSSSSSTSSTTSNASNTNSSTSNSNNVISQLSGLGPAAGLAFIQNTGAAGSASGANYYNLFNQSKHS